MLRACDGAATAGRATTCASCWSSARDRAAQAFAAKLEDHRELGLRVIGFLDDDPAVRPAEPLALPRAARRPRDDPPRAGRRRGRDLPAVLAVGPDRRDHAGSARRRARSSGSRWTSSTARSRVGPRRGARRDAGLLARLGPGPRARARRQAVARHRRRRRVGLVVLQPAPRSSIAVAIALDDGRPGPLPPGPGRPPRPTVRGRQVPVDARRRRGAAAPSSRTATRSTGHAFKMTDDPRVTRVGRFLRRTQPRRAAAAVERAARRDEPRRAATAAARRGRRLRPVAPPPAVDEARHHRPVAGPRRAASPTSTAGSRPTSSTSTAGRSGSTSRSSLRTIPAAVRGTMSDHSYRRRRRSPARNPDRAQHRRRRVARILALP